MPAYLETPFLSLFLCLWLLAVYGASLAWVYRDARRRGHRPWHAVAFVMITGWPLSLSIWLLLRSGRSLAPRGYGSAWG